MNIQLEQYNTITQDHVVINVASITQGVFEWKANKCIKLFKLKHGLTQILVIRINFAWRYLASN